jgi:beta-glucosidase
LDETHDVHVVKFTLRNVGSVRAAEIVQCYVHDMETTVYRPEQELKAFTKVWLNPGEQQTVELTLDRDAFAFYDVGHKAWIVEPGDFEIRVGASSRDVRLTTTIHLAGGHTPSARARDAHPPFHYHVHGHQRRDHRRGLLPNAWTRRVASTHYRGVALSSQHAHT